MFNAFTNEREYDKCKYLERIELNHWQKTITPLSSFLYTANGTLKTIAITGLAEFSEFINIAKTYDIDGEDYTVTTITDSATYFRECLGIKVANGTITDCFNNSKVQYILVSDSVVLSGSFLDNNQIRYARFSSTDEEEVAILNSCTAEVIEFGDLFDCEVLVTAEDVDLIVLQKSDLADAKELAMFADVLDKLSWKHTPIKDYDYKNEVFWDYEVVRAPTNLNGQGPVNLFNTSDIVRIRVITDIKPKFKSVIIGGEDLFNRRFIIKDISPLRYLNTNDSGAITMCKQFSWELELQGADV